MQDTLVPNTSGTHAKIYPLRWEVEAEVWFTSPLPCMHYTTSVLRVEIMQPLKTRLSRANIYVLAWFGKGCFRLLVYVSSKSEKELAHRYRGHRPADTKEDH